MVTRYHFTSMLHVALLFLAPPPAPFRECVQRLYTMIPSQRNNQDHPRGWTPINHLLPYGIRGSDRAESEVKTEDCPDQSVLNQPDSSQGGLKRRCPEMTHNYRPAVQDQLTSNSLKRLRLEHRAETEPVAPSINVAFSNPFANSRPQSMVPMRVAVPSPIRQTTNVAPILQARIPHTQSPPFDGLSESEAGDIPCVTSNIVDQPVSVPIKSKITTLRTGKKLPVARAEDWSSSSSDDAARTGSGSHDLEQSKKIAYDTRRRARYAQNQVMQNVRDVKFEALLAASKGHTGSELIDTKPQFAKGKRKVHEDGYSMTREFRSLVKGILH